MAEITILTDIGTDVHCTCDKEIHSFIASRYNTGIQISTLGTWLIEGKLNGKVINKRVIASNKDTDYVVELYPTEKPAEDSDIVNLDELKTIIGDLNTKIKSLNDKFNNIDSSLSHLTNNDVDIYGKIKDLKSDLDLIRDDLKTNDGQISNEIIDEIQNEITKLKRTVNDCNAEILKIKNYINKLPTDNISEEKVLELIDNRIINSITLFNELLDEDSDQE